LMGISDLQDSEHNDADAILHFRRASDKQVRVAQRWLGHLYEGWNGNSKDIRKAIVYYTLAAKSGDGVSQAALADIYFQKDQFDEAYYWYRLCQRKENADPKDEKISTIDEKEDVSSECEEQAEKTKKKLPKAIIPQIERRVAGWLNNHPQR
jgi:TPR repeat protein